LAGCPHCSEVSAAKRSGAPQEETALFGHFDYSLKNNRKNYFFSKTNPFDWGTAEGDKLFLIRQSGGLASAWEG